MIAYFASDLIWATRIKKAAEDLGLEARPVRSLEMLEARLADSDLQGLVVDLDAPELALDLVRRLRERQPSPQPRAKIVAFGPHVDADAFARAREAGADVTLTRGAFDARIAEVLTTLSSAGK